MAALPLPGSGPSPSFDPDEVGYTAPGPFAIARAAAESHTPETCTAEHCSCHLPAQYRIPELELTGREAMVLAWHLFPPGDEDELSFQQIGQRLGISQVRVRQIYQKAGAKLRAYPHSHYPPRPGTPEHAAQVAAAEKYKAEHPTACDGCSHPPHAAGQCPITRYRHSCPCDEPTIENGAD